MGTWGSSALRGIVLLMIAGALGVLSMAGNAVAAGPNAVQDLPGCTANTFAANDDGSVPDVPLGFTADFYGLPATTVNVNNNGNVTFDAPLSEYTPFDFTTAGNVILAPFLADVDTRGPGSSPVTYGTGTLPDGTTHYFCVNWVNVGYYGSHADKLNSFQLLLTQTSAEAVNGNFTITFNYDAVTWETGDASGGSNGFGGTPAAVGFSAGDGVEGHDSVQPGSFTSGALLDGDGATGLIHNSLNSGGQLGRYVFSVVNGLVSGGRVHGHVFGADGTTPIFFAPVQLCPSGGGACATRSTNSSGTYTAGGLAPGTYDVTAFPNDEQDGTAATVHGVLVIEGGDTAQDVTLGPAPGAPPAGTVVSGVGTNPGGIPRINWSETGTITTLACAGANLSYTLTVEGVVVAGGPMQEVPGSQDGVGGATYQATYPAVYPHHGAGHVSITGTCPGGGSTVDTEFGIYVDPSGKVLDTNGDPIAGATVTLRRSSTSAGPFVQIPDGSPEMSPSNRDNPDVTRADGSFGWDVVAGYYRVDATKDGCVAAADRANPVASSAVLQIPPPATGLVIRMYCGETPRGGGGGGGGQQPPRATAAAVEQAVAASLAGQLRSLLRQLAAKLSVAGTRSFSLPLSAAAPGTASLRVVTIPSARGHASAHRKRRPAAVLVASGRVSVGRAGVTALRVSVSARGRSLLRTAARRHARVKLRMTLAFTPTLDGRALSTAQTGGTLTVKPRAAKPRRRHRRQ